ncbi:transposase [Brevibacillus laterosporus]|nr:transposase family protein [Brevibacillus laterosporus]TPG81259.1 transposase [Brevibacillus laterosporus]
MKNTGMGMKQPNTIKPFQRVEFDGHQIDLILTVTFQNQYGDECTDTIERIWLLVIIDVATRVVLGYHVSIASQYSSSDVLACIRNAVEPNRIKTVSIPGLKYPETGGFHWQVVPHTNWALWNEFSYDNGKANLAKIVTNRLTNIVGCAVNPGPVNMPERRAFVERFFGLLEQNGYQRLYNTTGSNPSDPKRNHPEKNVCKYAMNVDELEQITAILISNYNRTPHSGLGYLSPLEVMEQRVMKGMEPRVLPEELRDEVGFFEMTITRIIRGNMKGGKRPYITFEGVEYRNDIVSTTFGMIGEQIFLLVNTDDIRFLKAYLKDGSELGYFTPTGRWGITPHSLQMRKQVNGLARKKLLHYTNLDDPIDALHKYLEVKATNNKKYRTKLAAVQRYQEQNPENDSINLKKKNKTNLSDSTNKNKVVTSKANDSDDLSVLRKRFKTIEI